jgi:hypothetical protein
MRVALTTFVTFLTIAIQPFAQSQAVAQSDDRQPIIDMHLHALDVPDPPQTMGCVPRDSFPAWDAKLPPKSSLGKCQEPLISPKTSDELMNETLALLDRFNITAVASGPPATVDRWKKAGGIRILPATNFGKDGPSLAELRDWVKSGRIVAFAEIGAQYYGIPANSELLEPYFALAEELDIPVGIHMGPGPPGAQYLGLTDYRARLSSLLLLEDVLVRHPKLRIWAMHAGWPLADDAIATLYSHSQLYVDIGVIDYLLPKAEFYGYLKRLIDAGFENRIMFGSDQMVWPQAISAAIDTIESAPFLTPEQKRDILYNNAARFLRLKP